MIKTALAARASSIRDAGLSAFEFFNSFFLFFYTRARGQAAKPAYMRVCEDLYIYSILPFLRLSLPFLRFVCLFCGVIHRLFYNLLLFFFGRSAKFCL